MKVKYALLLALLLYWGYHLYTLNLYPLPWEDDTTFASISLSIKNTGKFFCPVAHDARNYKEVLHYGPLYFVLGAGVFKTIGFSVWSLRLLSLLGAALVGFFLYRLLRLQLSATLAALFTALLLIDPFFQLSLHEGRMDLLATGLSLGAVFFYFEFSKDHKHNKLLISASLTALAMLTTPRAVLTPFFLFFIMMYDNLSIEDRKVSEIIWWIGLSLSIYLLWVFYAFGGPTGMLDYYTMISGVDSPEAYHPNFGFRPYIPKQEKLLIVTCLASSALALLINWKAFLDRLVVISILATAVFYVCFIDWGPYSVYVLPFYYYTLAKASRVIIECLQAHSWKKVAWVPIILLTLHHGAYSGIKAVFTLSNLEQRSEKAIDAFIAEHIPAGSKVLGYGLHYYAVIKAGADYQYIDKYNTLEVREERQRLSYNYDYIIVDGISFDKIGEEYKYYFERGHFVKVASYESSPSKIARLIGKLGLISDMESTGYNCVIYARVKTEEKGSLALE